MKRGTFLLVFLVSLVWLFGGCGGGDDVPVGPAGLTTPKPEDGTDGGTPAEEEPEKPREQDPEAITKLEELGAILEKNDDGTFVVVRLDENTKVRNSDMRLIEGVPFVETFSANQTAITDAGLKRLAPCRDIRELSLMGNPMLTGSGFEELQKLDKIESLALEGTAMSNSAMAHLKDKSALTLLNLSSTRVGDRGLGYIENLTNLEVLVLHGCGGVTDAGLKHLSKMTKLEWLVLSQTGVAGEGLNDLKTLAALKHLLLAGTRVTNDGLAGLQHLPQLEELSLDFATKITSDGMQHLKGLKNLKILGLWETYVGDDGLEQLKGLTGLEQLNLSQTEITDAGLAHLQGMTKLQWLDLSRTKTTDAGLEQLKPLQSLEILLLNHNRITDAGLEHLAELKQLKELSLLNTDVTEAGVTKLQQALPDCEVFWVMDSP